MQSQEDIEPAEEKQSLISRLTYDDLSALTGLSRDRISAGLSKLLEMQMIWKLDGSGYYGLTGFRPGSWVKLPGLALLSPGRTSFQPFSHFSLRSKHELNAMKLLMYYAFARDGKSAYTEASFETIFKRVGVPERDIPTANSLLLTTGFLVRTRAPSTDDEKKNAPNQYFLTGHNAFFLKKTSAAK